ncbi:MAG: sodium-dependent transporter [Clostridia bacterium]|nr:sodium-dependent transporter [Lachnospiraceae bacterium]NCC01642.1 sodium-dependent transporter [Clostridia bacterium]NCD01653.1 sodium-dependent transporter [Clostridia bacterium]
MENKSKNTFNTRLGFILASVGSAIGMGNIWMFPYRLGQNGGAAFLIPYFLFIVLFGYVGLSGEFALGRMTGTGPIGAYDTAMKTRGWKGGKFLGAIPLIGSFGIAIGYSVIVGWVLRSMFGSLTNQIARTGAEAYFAQATSSFGSVPWHLIVILLTAFILMRGVTKGIEKINAVLMPAFFILFFIIAIRVAFLPGSLEGYKYLFIPDWSALLKVNTWIMAMGQAFFSLSITGSGMIIYGSYLSKSENIIHSSCMTALLDTCAALLAGLAIIPAVFAFQMDPASGPPLMFITLPKVFSQIPFGNVIGTIFFLSVLFAGITSLMNMFEVCGEALQKSLGLSRHSAIALASGLIFLIGLFIENEARLGSWMDVITIYVVPFGALLGAFMIYWVLDTKIIHKELNLGAGKSVGKLFTFLSKYVYAILTVVVFILGIIYGGIG